MRCLAVASWLRQGARDVLRDDNGTVANCGNVEGLRIEFCRVESAVIEENRLANDVPALAWIAWNCARRFLQCGLGRQAPSAVRAGVVAEGRVGADDQFSSFRAPRSDRRR